MSINIEGKIAIVTGASRGIGEGIAKVFSNEGVTHLVHTLYMAPIIRII